MVKSKITLALVISIAFVAIMLALSGCGKEEDPYENSKPFENLSSSDVQAVYAVFGNYEPYKLSDEKDVEKLISLIKDIPIYNRDDSYMDLDGPSYHVDFLIEKIDGTKIKIYGFNEFFMIDNVGYKSDYDRCENLHEFAHPFIEEIRENGKLI